MGEETAADTLAPTSPEAGMLGRLAELADAGGPVIVVLTALSVVALAIVLFKLHQFARLGLWRRRATAQALSLWHAGRPEQALAGLHSVPHPAARPLAVAMDARAHGCSDERLLREEVERVAGAELDELRSYVPALELIAVISPLLGLFGTVLGMIEAFQQLEHAGGGADPAVLSGGIWEALLTTAAGLAVAIPATFAVHWLDRTIDRTTRDMEDAVTQVFTADLRLAHDRPSAVAATARASRHAL